MYWKLRRKMRENKIRNKDIAKLLGLGDIAISRRMVGDVSLKIDEAIKIRDAFFPDCTLDDLFVD